MTMILPETKLRGFVDGNGVTHKIADSAEQERPNVLHIDRTRTHADIFGGLTLWKGPKDGDGLSGEAEGTCTITELDITKLMFPTYIEKGEYRITGEDRREKIAVSGDQPLDTKVAWALHQEPGQKTLRRIHDEKKIRWMEFHDEVLRRGNSRGSLVLYRLDGGAWDWLNDWLAYYRSAFYPAVVIPKQAPTA